jgi:predicted RNase H-like nuclease (RuvC/YqgF family)
MWRVMSVTAEQLVAIIIALIGGGLIRELFSKKKTKADTAAVIVQAAEDLMKNYTTRFTDLESRLKASEGDNKELRGRVRELEVENKKLKTQISSIEGKVVDIERTVSDGN